MSEISWDFPQAPSRDVFPINNDRLNAKVKGTILHDFELLTTAGVRAPVCFGGALRDFHHGMVPNDYDFVGGLPSGISFVEGVCRIVGRLSGELADRQITTVTNAATQTARLLFSHMGRRIDLHLVSGQVPSVETMADYGSIGLCSIAVGAARQTLASPRYIDDNNNQTLTIRPGLGADEYKQAVQQVAALQKRYPDFTPILRVPTKNVGGRQLIFAYEG